MKAGELAAVAALACVAAACSKGRDAAARGAPETMALSAPQSGCAHALCADNFFVDVASGRCAAGGACNVTLKLVATGEFHVNDEYPYKFKADEAPGVEFLGTDGAGKNVFSKAAGDWQKTDEKSGVMTVKFKPQDHGNKTIAGVFKLSVCSAQNCLLEQRPVAASVVVN